MIAALATLLGFQLAGEALAHALGLPVPGPVIGMLLLLAFLVVRGEVDRELRTTTNGLLQHLSLLFVPAGTGVMLHFHRLGAEWLPILLALVASTLLGLAATAMTLRLLAPARPAQEEDRL